jgi:lipopolysaccharide biosynthesis glycosyltransferase
MRSDGTRPSSNVVVVTASDEGYVMPLAAMIRSALDTLGKARRLRLFVLDGGISDESKRKLLASWDDSRLEVSWHAPDASPLQDYDVSGHVNIVTYFRLLMPEMLPADVTRVLYLDPDLIVRRDLGELWDTPQGDHPVLAVTDIACPYLDAPRHLAAFESCKRHLAAWTPIINFRELGLRGDANYFNAGVLAIGIDIWRRERLGQRMMQALHDLRDHVLWHDQYALNVMMSGRWGKLDPRWNQGGHLFVYPRWNESPLDRDAFYQLRNDPWIVHFSSADKPWNYFCAHPWTNVFRATLGRTEWRDWRPTPPADYWDGWKKARYEPVKKRVEAELRAWRDAAPLRKRAA